jgi:hypothetical protein
LCLLTHKGSSAGRGLPQANSGFRCAGLRMDAAGCVPAFAPVAKRFYVNSVGKQNER